MHGGTEGERGLEARALHGVGTAVRTPDQPVPLQPVEIAPYGLLGDPEFGGELADVHGSETAGRFQNSPSSLLGVHGDTSVSRLRAW
jgi:hypothetical protein